MKKNTILALILFSNLGAFAQEIVPEQLVSFQEEQTLGDARYMALSGAMGAVGANGSAITFNPASSGRYNFDHFSFTTLLTFNEAKATYLGNQNTENGFNFSVPNFAVVMPDLKVKEDEIEKGVFSVSFQTKSKFFNKIEASGTSSESGVQYFMNHANTGYNGGAVPLNLVQTRPNETIGGLYDYLNGQAYGFSAQQAMLGYQGYLLNDQSSGYQSNMLSGDYTHHYQLSNSGAHSVIAINGSKVADEHWTVGGNINIHMMYQTKSTTFAAQNSGGAVDGRAFAYEFLNETHSSGLGFSFQLGGIYTYENLRLGLAIETPTWAKIEDEFQQRLITKRYTNSSVTTADINPDLITVFEPYGITLPGSLSASFGYLFNKKGFISFDYQIKNPSWTRYRSEGFDALNDFFKNELQATHDLRVGGEVRLTPQFSLRAGYRTLSSAYKNNPWIGALQSYSAGFGYSFGRDRLDFGYVYTLQNRKELPLTSGLTQSISTDQSRNQFAITYSIMFD